MLSYKKYHLYKLSSHVLYLTCFMVGFRVIFLFTPRTTTEVKTLNVRLDKCVYLLFVYIYTFQVLFYKIWLLYASCREISQYVLVRCIYEFIFLQYLGSFAFFSCWLILYDISRNFENRKPKKINLHQLDIHGLFLFGSWTKV